MIPATLLKRITSRFLKWNPECDEDFIKLFFAIEKSHWFYIDNYVTVVSKEFQRPLEDLKINEFAWLVFEACANLKMFIEDLEQLLTLWKEHKRTLPRFGAILLNKKKSHVLMVKCGTTWGFPRGKREGREKHHQAAQREVLEETGFDIASYISHHRESHLFRFVHGAPTKLYIITGVSESFDFKAKTKNEIKGIRWVDLKSLPNMESERTWRNSYFTAVKFVDPLREWVENNP